MVSPIPFNPLSFLAFIPLAVMVAYLSLAKGLEVPLKQSINQSSALTNLAELAIWESLGTSDVYFDSADSFVTSLRLGGSPDYDKGMRFVLFNRENRQNGIEITSDPDNLKKYLNPNIPTKIFIHGFQNELESKAPVIIRNAYLDHGDYNMILVDWAKLAVAPNYVAARSHAVEVANRTSLLLNALAESKICAPKDQHIIGHSLGGQIAGLAAGAASTKPGRCTGLDPAGPLFQVATTSGRINSVDADLVDVIHTSAALWGFPGPVGHVDFYPNGGVWSQPGCVTSEDLDGECSHTGSVKFFAHSISNPDAYIAFRCQTHTIVRGKCPKGTENATMGEKVRFQTPGMYYLEAKVPS